MSVPQTQKAPPIFKRSPAKIWIRTGILAVFGTLFGIVLYHDIVSGAFRWQWGLPVFLICLPLGFWMRKLVPMQVHPASRHVTLSFDRVYFALILLLVAVKTVVGNLLHATVLADVIVCVILGLMTGRLSGICVRVHDLKPEDLSR